MKMQKPIPIKYLRSQVISQANILYARGENPTCYRIAENLLIVGLTFSYIEPLLKLWKESQNSDLRSQVYWRSGERESAFELLNQYSTPNVIVY